MQSPHKFVLAALLFAAPLVAQSPIDPIPAAGTSAHYDPHAAVATALQRLDDAEKDVRRFTYIEDLQMANITRSGRPLDYSTRKYETTYINGHPYMRLLEKDGAPLTGSDLKSEQKRFDKAVAKKKDLDENKRADTDDYTVIKKDFLLKSVLEPSYTLKVAAAGSFKGEPAHLIEATPIPGVKRSATCPWHVRIWIADKTGNLRRYVADTADDTRPECEKAAEDTSYIEVDGLPKISSTAARFNNLEIDGHLYASKSVVTYSNYRRFGATITIHNGDIVSPDDAPSTPPPPPEPAPTP